MSDEDVENHIDRSISEGWQYGPADCQATDLVVWLKPGSPLPRQVRVYVEADPANLTPPPTPTRWFEVGRDPANAERS